MTKIILTASIGHIEQQRGYQVVVIELMNDLDREVVEVRNVAEIKAAVAKFGAAVAAKFPGKSFCVSTVVGRNERKPNGFDKMNSAKQFGNYDWMKVEEPRPAMA
jgi:hypothetical protein